MVRLSSRYATHLPVLIQAIYRTRLSWGKVLELGVGGWSTPVVNHLCAQQGRKAVSIDNSPEFYEWAKRYQSANHDVLFVDNWDDAPIDNTEWDVALVDHSQSERRVEEIKRLSQIAKYIVVHDSNGRYSRHYHYDTVFPMFKHILNYAAVEPSTTILSNLVDLSNFWSIRNV